MQLFSEICHVFRNFPAHCLICTFWKSLICGNRILLCTLLQAMCAPVHLPRIHRHPHTQDAKGKRIRRKKNLHRPYRLLPVRSHDHQVGRKRGPCQHRRCNPAPQRTPKRLLILGASKMGCMLRAFLCSTHHRSTAHPAIDHRQDHHRIRNQYPERVASYIIYGQAADQQKGCCQKLSDKALCLRFQLCRRQRRLIPRPDVLIAVPAFLIIFSIILHVYSFLLKANSFLNPSQFLFLTNYVIARIVTLRIS